MDTTGLLEPDFNDDEMFSYNPMWKCNLDATYAAFQREKSEKKRSLSPVNDDADQCAPSPKRLKDQHANNWKSDTGGAECGPSMIEADDEFFLMEPKKPKPALSTESFELVTEAPANGIGGQPLYSHHEHPSPQETEVDSARNAPKTTGSKKSHKTHAKIGKNKIRYTDQNGLEVELGTAWVPAIEHPDFIRRLRFQVIDPANYARGRASGTDPGDFTAYLPSQHSWGGKREDRPGILFEYKVPQSGWQSSSPSLLSFNDNGVNRVIIDVINHRPLRRFANLPIKISTKVEGWLMEAWERQDRSIEFEDLIQRMNFTADSDVWTNRKFTNALTQRKDRFRNRGRCLSWKMIEHNREWDRKLEEDMEANKEWLRANTTRYLSDLTVEEDKALTAATFLSRKHVQRAGGRQLQGDAKVKKETRMRKMLEDGNKKNAAACKDLRRSSQDSDNDLEKTIQRQAPKEVNDFSDIDERAYGVLGHEDYFQLHNEDALATCPLEALIPGAENQLQGTQAIMKTALPDGASQYARGGGQPASSWNNESSPNASSARDTDELDTAVKSRRMLKRKADDSWELRHTRDFSPEHTANTINARSRQSLPELMSPAMQNDLNMSGYLLAPTYPSLDISTRPQTTTPSHQFFESPKLTSNTRLSYNSFDAASTTTRQNSPPAKKRRTSRYSPQSNSNGYQPSHYQSAAYEQQGNIGGPHGNDGYSKPSTMGYVSPLHPYGANPDSYPLPSLAETNHRVRTQAETLPGDIDESINPQHEKHSAVTHGDDEEFFATIVPVPAVEETPELRPSAEVNASIDSDLDQLPESVFEGICSWLESPQGQAFEEYTLWLKSGAVGQELSNRDFPVAQPNSLPWASEAGREFDEYLDIHYPVAKPDEEDHHQPSDTVIGL